MNWQTTFLSALIVIDTCCQQSVFSQPGSVIPLSPDCSAVTCPRPLCANPKPKPGDCCLTCEDSKCKFEGCVNFMTDGRVQWAPRPCYICVCNEERNEKYCGYLDCVFPKEDPEACLGYPVVTKPNECCPRCDFGIEFPDDTCGVVPRIYGKWNISVSAKPGYSSCSKTIIRNKCDKIGFRSKGKKYRCIEVEGSRTIRFDQNCPLSWGTYNDVTSCKAVEDDNLVVGCDLVV